MLLFEIMLSYYIKCNPRFSAEQAGLHHSGITCHCSTRLQAAKQEHCAAILYDGTSSFRITNPITLLASG